MNKRFHISNLIYIFLLLVGLGIGSCATNKIVPKDNSYQYDTKIKDLNPHYVIYHKDDTVSYLYLEIETKDLLYVRENSTKPFEAKLMFHYEMYENYKGKVLLDSASKVLYDYKTEVKNKHILARIPLSMNLGERGVIRIIAYDFNKKIKSEVVIEVDKKNTFSKQFFLVKDKNSGDVCFNSYFSLTDELHIISDYNANESFFLDYFNTSYSASVPPFSRNVVIEIPDKRDSVALVSTENGMGEMDISKKGTYFLKSIDSVSYSFSIQKLDSNFNSFQNYLGMIEPLKYICTSSEYTSLENAEDKRAAVEGFWLKIAGTKERARVIIEEYYRRVELANKYFTTYKEGWKTDRGMLSIVMGLPKTIYKARDGETWIYGSTNNMMMSLTFTFNKENEDKSDNDYQLVRYRTYRDYWYRACKIWRQGRIYNYN